MLHDIYRSVPTLLLQVNIKVIDLICAQDAKRQEGDKKKNEGSFADRTTASVRVRWQDILEIAEDETLHTYPYQGVGSSGRQQNFLKKSCKQVKWTAQCWLRLRHS